MMKNYETKILYKLNENEETIDQDFYVESEKTPFNKGFNKIFLKDF